MWFPRVQPSHGQTKDKRHPGRGTDPESDTLKHRYNITTDAIMEEMIPLKFFHLAEIELHRGFPTKHIYQYLQLLALRVYLFD